MHTRNCFVTLTYDDESIRSDGSLDLEHWKLFRKRLRERRGPFRYLHCGEYGENTGRPHYHALLFGIDFADDQVLYEDRGTHRSYTSEELSDVWGHGFVTVGEMSFESAAYVARYTTKKLRGKIGDEAYEGIKPPYITMSLKPGLGATWLEKYHEDVYPDDFVIHGGRKYPTPTYYDRLMEEKDPAFMRGVRAARVRRMNERKDDVSPDRLAARERITEARMSVYQRRVDT